MTRRDRIEGTRRETAAALIRSLADVGSNDTAIADQLGLTPRQVRGIRVEYGIAAGSQRWKGRS